LLYDLSHNSSPFYYAYFGDGISQIFTQALRIKYLKQKHTLFTNAGLISGHHKISMDCIVPIVHNDLVKFGLKVQVTEHLPSKCVPQNNSVEIEIIDNKYFFQGSSCLV
jgi:hypothetical protein